MKSSQIFGHLPNSFLTRSRQFQSSPIRRVNHSIGNTASSLACTMSSLHASLTKLVHLTESIQVGPTGITLKNPCKTKPLGLMLVKKRLVIKCIKEGVIDQINY